MGVTMSASAAPRTVLLDDKKVVDMQVSLSNMREQLAQHRMPQKCTLLMQPSSSSYQVHSRWWHVHWFEVRVVEAHELLLALALTFGAAMEKLT